MSNKMFCAVRMYLSMVFILPMLSVVSADSAPVLWPSSSLSKVMRSATPDGKTGSVLSVSGAGAEIVSAQAVFRSPVDVKAATVSITSLEHTRSNAKIPASAVKLQWVRYIDITWNTRGIPDDELVAKAPASIPDAYWENLTIPVKANQAQPVWLEIEVPSNTIAGDYKGKLTVTADGKPIELLVILHVWDFELPKERHVSVINWWRFPKKYPVEPYSPEYWQFLGRWCRFVVRHRQTDVQVGLNKIKETGNKKQGYSYDTSAVERFAEVAFGNGIRQIHLGSVGSRKGDWESGTGKIKPVESRMRRLAAFEKVIRRRNWQRRFLVSIADEPYIHHEASYAAMVDRVHKIAASVRCIEAVESEYFGELDIYVPKLNHLASWLPAVERMRSSGKEIWFYTCSQPLGRYPNRFLDQSLLKTRILHWINYRYDLKGYLHWALDGFDSEEPFTAGGISRDGILPLGDCTITYPGRNMLLGSLRFSAMRDGLEDFEYLWLLENELAQIKKRFGDQAFWFDTRQRPLELCRRVIESFHDYTRDDSVLLDTRRAIAEEIESLKAKPLLIVQTSPPENTVLHHGPLNACVRGLTSPGAKVTINGKVSENITPNGYFTQAHFFSDGKQTITVTAELNGQKQTVVRKFKLAD